MYLVIGSTYSNITSTTSRHKMRFSVVVIAFAVLIAVQAAPAPAPAADEPVAVVIGGPREPDECRYIANHKYCP
ncbi:hypothetical protein FBU30_001923 [Linnemannia zychae]|nr:hypothetical protein FBU30_001923 [Linnemannia zychae]